MSESTGQSYEFAARRLLPAGLMGPLLEAAQKIPHIHEVMPEPFDVTNHAGNIGWGAAVASVAVIAYAVKNNNNDGEPRTVDDEAMSRFRKYGVATVCGVTALANCVTETRWGVKHVPIAEGLGGPAPSILDTLYSTAYAGLLCFAFWRKRPTYRP